jgi:hypothetical protein
LDAGVEFEKTELVVVVGVPVLEQVEHAGDKLLE